MTPGLSSEQVDVALAQLIEEGEALVLGRGTTFPRPTDFAVAATLWQSLSGRITEVLRAYHGAQPLRPGMPREEVRSRIGMPQPRLFDDLISTAAGTGVVIDDGASLRLPEFRMSLDPARRGLADTFLAAIRAQPYTPPGPHEFNLDPETLAALEHFAEIEKVGDGVYFTPDAWNALVQGTLAFIDRNGSMTLSQFRDHFGTSRKYAQAALEHLDQLKYTRRVGDDRVRGPRRPGTA